MGFVLKLYRNKKFITGLAAIFSFAVSSFLFGTAVGFGSPKFAAQEMSYKTSLGVDLDGDHIPETVTVRQRGSHYQVTIHFSTGRPRLRLRTYVGDDIAGLAFEVADVNSDSEADLVITSATSIWPIAVWLNRGSANFHRVNARTYRFAGQFSGPRLRPKTNRRPDAIGSLANHRLLQAEGGASFRPYTGLQDFISVQAAQLRFDSSLEQTAPRGPPSAHI